MVNPATCSNCSPGEVIAALVHKPPMFIDDFSVTLDALSRDWFHMCTHDENVQCLIRLSEVNLVARDAHAHSVVLA